jgi:hypothetical protein
MKNKYRLKNKTITYKNVHFKVYTLLQFGFIQKVIDPNKNTKLSPERDMNIIKIWNRTYYDI